MHEVAHLVDALDGDIDGVPPLPAADREAWIDGIEACRERFEIALDEGRSTAFDEYAAESAVEFFAVASECFFQDPHRLARHDGELYGLLTRAWRQDPQRRVPAHPSRGR
jgi:Mlc titration factor MtfA (ptsG expression regulator)